MSELLSSNVTLYDSCGLNPEKDGIKVPETPRQKAVRNMRDFDEFDLWNPLARFDGLGLITPVMGFAAIVGVAGYMTGSVISAGVESVIRRVTSQPEYSPQIENFDY